MAQLQQRDSASQVFVGGTTGVSEKELRDHCEAYGSMSSVRLPYDLTERRQGFRQRHAQHSGSISQTASISLLDILFQIPTLPDILTPDSQKALSATCKSCRVQFIANVQVVTVACVQDYALAVQRRWPRVSMVIIQGMGPSSFVGQPSNNMIHISTRSTPKNQATISLLRPLHNVATDLPWTHLAAQQLAHQIRRRWPSIGGFSMTSSCALDGLGQEIVSQHVKGNWTQLGHLTLSGCELNAKGLWLLSQCNLPRLNCLNLSGNCIDAKGMALLAKGNWPLLTTINLSCNPAMDAVAVAHLSVANWPIETLMIDDTPFSSDMVAELADLQLPHLRVLHLSGSALTAAGVAELAKADWPSLEDITIGHDDLDAVAVLFGVDQEKVQELKSRAIAYVVFDNRTLSSPDMGLWPNLSWVCVSKDHVKLML